MWTPIINFATVALLLAVHTDALAPQPTRREAVYSGLTAAALTLTGAIAPRSAWADENQVLSEEEMAARIARKLELQNRNNLTGRPVAATAARSDVNPQASVDLRSRSAVENAKLALAKQEELKKRDKLQKREDLCEMLGRGC